MRERATHNGRVQHVRKVKVVNEASPTCEQLGVIAAQHILSDIWTANACLNGHCVTDFAQCASMATRMF